MENIAQLGIKVDSTDIKSATNELTNLSNQSGKTEQKTQSLVSSVAKLAGSYIALSQAMDAGRYFLKTADAMTLVDSRLKLATNSAESFAKAQQELYNISQLTRTQLTSTVDLFERMTRSTRDYKLSQDELLGITQTINKAMIISGGTAESMNASIIQLGQALSADFKGVGQELASIREQTPRLYQALLDGTKKSSDAFRKLAEDGKLSTKIIIDALKSQGISVDAEFLKINKTVAQSQIQVSNAMGVLIKNFNDMTGLTEGLAEGFTTLSKNINSISSEDIQKYIDLTKTVGSLAASLGGAILVFSTYNKVAGIASTLSIAYAASLNTVNAAILLTAASTKILNAALKASPLGVVAGAIYLLSESFTDAKTRSDNLSVSVKTLANDLSVLDAKSRLVDVNKQLKEMDDRFKNYSETQKLMYKGAYDLQYKEKLQLEGVIKLSEEKNELIKKGEDELKKNVATTTEISDNLKNMLDPVQAIKNKYIEYRKELEKSGNATKENLEKLKQLEQSDLEALSKKLNKTEDLEKANKKLEETEKARSEIAQIGMSEYEKSLTSINEKYQYWREAGVDINTALAAQLQLVTELNAQTLSETLLEGLSYYERKVQLQSDSLAKELELQGIAYSNAVLNIENSDKTIEQKERLIALEAELYELSIAKLEEDSNTEFQDTLLEFQDEALQRQIDLNQAMYDFSGSFDGISGQISNVSKSMIAMSGISLKTKKAEIDLNKKYEKEFTKAAGNVAKTKALEIQYTKDSSALTAQSNEAEMAGYANLAGAMASAFEQGSAGAIAFTAVQSALGIASSWTAIAGAWALPFPANLPAVAAVTAAVMPIIAQLGGSSGGGGSVSIPSVADTAQEKLDFENTMVVDRLDRQIELLEELNLQGSAAKLQVQSAGLQFDYEQSSARNTIRKKMEENLGAWQSEAQVSIFNSQQSDIGYKGDMIDYFMANSPFKVWEEYSIRTTGGIHDWWSQYMDVTQRQFEEMRNEFQNKMSDFALDVIGTINNLKDTGKDLKETYDELTDSQKYANIELMEAINQVDKLRGERSFANYIEDEIENITKLEKELTADRISLLLSEDIADMRAKVDLINYLSDQTGIAFKNGAEDVLNYLDAIELVSEAMTTSTANIKSFYDSFKSDDELAQSLATQMGETLATTYDELAALFVKLENDTLGLTDADLELLESNISFIERLEDAQLAAQNKALQAQKDHLQDKLNAENDYYKTITSSISSITSILSTLDNAIEKLRGASETSETSLSKFYLSMAETQSLMGGNDYDAIKESLSKTVGYSSVLMSTKNFASQEEMAYAQQLAANQLEAMDLTLNDELDYLEKIEENTRNTVAALTQSISNMGTQISDSISNQPDYSEIIDKVNGIKDSNTNFVNEVYKNTYGREADEQGLSYWVNQLNTGGLGKSNIQSAMAAAAVGSGEISKSKYVEIFYQLGLGRSADSEALKYWENYDASIYELYDIMRSVAVANGDTYTPFANGGIVTSPTLGLIGEAGYSEAVIPLKNPNDPLNQAALIGEVRALRSEVAYLNTLNEKQTATQIKTLSETRMIKGLTA